MENERDAYSSSEDGEFTGLLFKYYSLDSERLEFTQRALTHREVFFSPRRLFNDPYDCHPVITPEGTKEDCVRMFRSIVGQHAKNVGRDLTESEVGAIAVDMALREYPPTRAKVQKFEEYTSNHLDSMGVLCLSKRSDCPSMWAHYANSHNGICIGYRFLPQMFGLLPGFEARPVEYSDARPSLGIFDTPGDRGAVLVGTKSAAWSYEAEYRIVNLNGYGVQRLMDAYIALVIVGVEVPGDMRERVADWVGDFSYYRPDFAEATVSSSKFVVEHRVVSAGSYPPG